jgi:hypothetical protein
LISVLNQGNAVGVQCVNDRFNANGKIGVLCPKIRVVCLFQGWCEIALCLYECGCDRGHYLTALFLPIAIPTDRP